MEQQVSYLLQSGHRRIAYLRGIANYDGDCRYQIFRKCMADYHLSIDESLMLDGQFSEKIAYYCVHYLLRSQHAPLPDAFLCANDDMAFGCIKALNDLGYQVPQDVSVLGFDDLIAGNCNPPLSTVDYSMASFAKKQWMKPLN